MFALAQLLQQPIASTNAPSFTPEIPNTIRYYENTGRASEGKPLIDSYLLIDKAMTKAFLDKADHPITAAKQGVGQFINKALAGDDGGVHYYSLAKLVAKRAMQYLDLLPEDKEQIYAQLTQCANMLGYTKEAIRYGKRYTKITAKRQKQNGVYTFSHYTADYHFSHALYKEGRIDHSHSILLTMRAAVEKKPTLLKPYQKEHLQTLFLTVHNEFALKNALQHYDGHEYQSVLTVLDDPLANLKGWNVKRQGLVIASRIHLGLTQDARFSALVDIYLEVVKQGVQVSEIAHRQLIKLATQSKQYKKAYSLLKVLLGKFGVETLQGFSMFQDLVMFADVYFENGHYKNASYCAKTACDIYGGLANLSSNDMNSAKRLMEKSSDILFESVKALPPEWKDYWFILKVGLAGAASDVFQDVKGNAVPLMGVVAALVSYFPLRRIYSKWWSSKRKSKNVSSMKRPSVRKSVIAADLSKPKPKPKPKSKSKPKFKSKSKSKSQSQPQPTPISTRISKVKRLDHVQAGNGVNQSKNKVLAHQEKKNTPTVVKNNNRAEPRLPSNKKLKQRKSHLLAPVLNVRNTIRSLCMNQKDSPSSYYPFAAAYLLNIFFTAIHSLPQDCGINLPFETRQEINGFTTLLLADTEVLDALVKQVALSHKNTLERVVKNKIIVENAASLKTCPKKFYQECLLNVFEMIGRPVLSKVLIQGYSEEKLPQVFCFAAKMLLMLLYHNVNNKDWKAIIKDYPNADQLAHGSPFKGVDCFTKNKLRPNVQDNSPLSIKKIRRFLRENTGRINEASIFAHNVCVSKETYEATIRCSK